MGVLLPKIVRATATAGLVLQRSLNFLIIFGGSNTEEYLFSYSFIDGGFCRYQKPPFYLMLVYQIFEIL